MLTCEQLKNFNDLIKILHIILCFDTLNLYSTNIINNLNYILHKYY